MMKCKNIVNRPINQGTYQSDLPLASFQHKIFDEKIRYMLPQDCLCELTFCLGWWIEPRKDRFQVHNEFDNRFRRSLD